MEPLAYTNKQLEDNCDENPRQESFDAIQILRSSQAEKKWTNTLKSEH